MPRQNRVTPYGELIAVPDRGMFWGNRGALLNEAGALARYSTVQAWAICVLSFKGRRRVQWQPRRLTELYFLDEATALAAGHRPCGECRYQAYQEFKRCFGGVPVHEIDSLMHADRLVPVSGLGPGPGPLPGPRRRPWSAGAEVRRFYTAALGTLPDGTMVDVDGVAYLLNGGRLLRWTPGGYEAASPARGDVTVITPRSTVAALAAGYLPVLHPTATVP